MQQLQLDNKDEEKLQHNTTTKRESKEESEPSKL